MVDGKEICLVRIAKSGKPVFVHSEGKDEFFIRAGCSSQPLTREKMLEYVQLHWPA